MKKYNRRNFLKKTSLSTVALSSTTFVSSYESDVKPKESSGGVYMGGYAAPKIEKLRIAVIGVGGQGRAHAKQFAHIENTEIIAISDLHEDLVNQSVSDCIEKGNGRHQNIARYYGDENRWKSMLQEVKPDVVIIATNWNNHAPMAIESMKQGAHAFVEVPLAVTLNELWEIVDTSEQTQKHCMMM